MNAQQIIGDGRVLHIRELKTEVAKLRAENSQLHDENAQLLAHLDLAITAARDLESLPEDGKLVIVDGWNMILGATKIAKDKDDLLAKAKAYAAENPKDFVWIVYDGPRFSATTDGRIRVSYTGGTGEHRADKFICDFLRMARLRGDIAKIEVRTYDKDFLRDIARIRGESR